MKISKFVGSASIAAAVALTAIGISYAQQASQDPKPAQYRQNVMKAMAANVAAIFMNVKGDVDAKQNIAHHAQSLHHAALLLPTVFPKGSEGGGMKPEMWDEIDKVLANAKAVGEVTAKLVEVASTGDLAKIGQAAGDVGKACGACHETYKIPFQRQPKP